MATNLNPKAFAFQPKSEESTEPEQRPASAAAGRPDEGPAAPKEGSDSLSKENGAEKEKGDSPRQEEAEADAKPAAGSKMNAKAAAFVPSFTAAPFEPTPAPSVSEGQDIPGMPGFTMPFVPPGVAGVGAISGVGAKPGPPPGLAPTMLNGTGPQQRYSQDALEPTVTSTRFNALEDEQKEKNDLNFEDFDDQMQSVFSYLHQENMLTATSFQTIDNSGASHENSRIVLNPFWSEYSVADFHGMAEAILAVEECRAESQQAGRKKTKRSKEVEGGETKDTSDGEGEGSDGDVDVTDFVGVVCNKDPGIPSRFLEAYCQQVVPSITDKAEVEALKFLIEEMYMHRHHRLTAAHQELGDEVGAPPSGNIPKQGSASNTAPMMFVNEATRQEVSEAVGFCLMLFYTALRCSAIPPRTERRRLESLRNRLYSCPGSRSFVRWILPLMLAADSSKSSIQKAKNLCHPPARGHSESIASKCCDIKSAFSSVIPKLAMTFLALPPRAKIDTFHEKLAAHLVGSPKMAPLVTATFGDLVYGYPRFRELVTAESSNTALFLTTRPMLRFPAVAPPKVQAVLTLENKSKPKLPKPVTTGTGATEADPVAAHRDPAVPTPATAPGQTTTGPSTSTAAAPVATAATAGGPTVRIGQSTHKARPLAMTDFMEDVRRQMRTGYLTREMALNFAIQGIVESEDLATHTLAKTLSALETVVNDGIWTPLEDICALPPPKAVADLLDVVHTYIMPRDYLHTRMVTKASKTVAARVKKYKKQTAGLGQQTAATVLPGLTTSTNGPSGLPAAPVLGMDVGVWGATSGGATW